MQAVLVRAYGSHLMGMGHLYRVKRLIRSIKATTPTRIVLLTRRFPEAESIYRTIGADEVVELARNIGETREAELIAELVDKYSFTICINDQLNTSIEVADALNRNVGTTITFDDLGAGSHLFDHAINVLYHSDGVLENELTSYQYLLLEDDNGIKKEMVCRETVSTIFLNQGAADTWGAIPDLIDDLNKLSFDFDIRVLLGPAFVHFDELAGALERNSKRIEIFRYVDHVASLVRDVDLAIMGGGNSLFEVAALGVPIIASTREKKELSTIYELLSRELIYGEGVVYTGGLDRLIEVVLHDFAGRKRKYHATRDAFTTNGVDNVLELIA